ncbi:hypothetical protein HPB49_017586 [Dermacentor silvarum]|uniref:Uncharacterized protein n=1 Tax=Dermacentor silvarum TaxID=543639 RepID=A0ACB8CAM1_DERSI|nr:hypothetical protein HPB49_017586 [Dermacentor silvarum]
MASRSSLLATSHLEDPVMDARVRAVQQGLPVWKQDFPLFWRSGEAMARPADVSSISSVSAPEDSPDDLVFDLPADLLDLSFDLPPDEASSSGSTACDATGPSAAEPPQPKQRKKKSKHLPAMPVLRSSRGRDLKFTVRYKSEGFKDDDTPWTVTERKRLLAALKEHGSSDVSKLAEAVRTRSVAAVSHFLKERRRMKDRVVIQGPAGNRAAYSCRILRRALNVIRRRYDRTKVLPQVVAVCERQPFPEPAEDSAGELPQFEDLYQFMRELMDNHVPAVLEDCEHWLLNRLLLKLGTMIETLDLDASKQALKKGLLWAAVSAALASLPRSVTHEHMQAHRFTFLRLVTGRKQTR